jgi:hypothetical protein
MTVGRDEDRPDWVWALCAALLVSVPSVGFVWGLAHFHHSLSDFRPARPDEVGYFLQSQAYCQSGFHAGYFTLDEEPARASFSHFGVHGPVFPVLYGSLGRLFGLSYRSAPLFNVALLTAALAVYIALVRPPVAVLLGLSAFVLTYWHYYVFVYSWMQETTHLAIAVVVAGIFTSLLWDTPLSRTAAFRAGAVAFIASAALLRISWALMLPPLALLCLPRLTRRASLAALGVSFLGILGLLWTFRWLCAPMSSKANAFMMNKLLTLDVEPHVVLELIWTNLESFSRYRWLLEPVILDEHWSVLLLTGALVAGAAFVRFGPRRLVAGLNKPTRPGIGAALVCFYNQAVITVATVTTYLVGNGGMERMCATHALLSLFIAAASGKRSLQLLFLAALGYNLAMSPKGLEDVEDRIRPAFSPIPGSAEFAARIQDRIEFVPGADAWDNTLLSDRYPRAFLALPPGIGVSVMTLPQCLDHPRSRYVIASPQDVERAGAKLELLCPLKELRGERMLDAAAEANLYLNLQPAR